MPSILRLNHQCLLPVVQVLALPLYWLIGGHLVGLGSVAAIGFAALAPFAIHTAVVGVGFVVSYLHQHERPGFRHSRRRDWLIAFPREAAVSIRQFYWLMPFRAGFRVPEPVAPLRRPPLLLVHGYGCNRGLWLPAAKWFSRHGYRISAIDLSPMHGSIDRYAQPIARAIAEIRADTGADQVAVIGHSMGGLAARAYLRHCADQQIDPHVTALVTLGTPHHGTHLAKLGRGMNARQMHFGSDWIGELVRHEAATVGLVAEPALLRRTTTIGSLQDNIVTRPLEQRLPGVRAIMVRRQGHMSLVCSPRVLRLLDRLLARGLTGSSPDLQKLADEYRSAP